MKKKRKKSFLNIVVVYDLDTQDKISTCHKNFVEIVCPYHLRPAVYSEATKLEKRFFQLCIFAEENKLGYFAPVYSIKVNSFYEIPCIVKYLEFLEKIGVIPKPGSI